MGVVRSYFDSIAKELQEDNHERPRHHATIARLVPEGSRVLDLGCGDGALLDLLQRERGCSGYGIELADANVLACVRRGVNVIQLNLDEGLAMFGDNSFDVVLQIDTCSICAMPRSCCARRRAWAKAASSPFPTLRTGRTACRCCADACRSRAPALPVVRHAQHPRVGTYKGLRGAGVTKTSCASWTPSACRTGARCAGCPMHWRARRCSPTLRARLTKPRGADPVFAGKRF